VLGDVRGSQFIHRLAEHPAPVGGHVALADYGNDSLRQMEGAVAVFRMAVVPGNKRESGVAAGQLFAGNAETPVRLGAARRSRSGH